MQPLMRASSFDDWLSISLRWLFLFGITWVLSVPGAITLQVTLVLLAAVLYNTLLSVAAGLQRRIFSHTLIVLIIDTLLVQALAFLSGGPGSPVVWIGLIPIASAALFYQTRGALVVGLLNLALQLWTAWMLGFGLAWMTFLPVGVLYLILAVIFGLIAHPAHRAAERYASSSRTIQQNAERVESEHRRSIYKMLLALSATLNYERVLETALDLSAAGWVQEKDNLLVSAVMMYSSDASGTSGLRVSTSRRFTPADARIVLQGTEGLMGKAIDEGSPQMTSDIAGDPELSRIVALRACQAAYCIPLRTGFETCGVLLYAHPDQDYFNSDRCEYLDAIGNQAMVAIQNARLYRDLEQEKERVTAIEEDARKKLARDLHDGPTQSVAAIAMQVNLARRVLERDAMISPDELLKIEELARRTTKEIRHLLFTLRPLVLESHGLVPAFHAMAEKMKETFDQEVVVEAEEGLVAGLDLSRQGVIFAIAEEAVNNARKHAQAECIVIRLKPAGPGLALLEVEDNGAGFDLASMEKRYEERGSLGMVNMRERAELVNGYFQVESAVGQGTRVRLIIPLTSDAADRLRRGT